MPNTLSISKLFPLEIDNMISLTFALTALIALILYWAEHRSKQKILQYQPHLTPGEAEEKSYNVLHKAVKKASSLIGQAELEGVKIAAHSKFETKKLEKKYAEQMEEVREGLEKAYTNQITLTQTDFTKFLEDLKVSSEQTQNLTQEVIKQRVNEMLEVFEQNLSSFLTQTEQKSTQAIDLELKAAKELIDTYKRQQLDLIDSNIVSMLEKTLSLILPKKLTLRDQVDLVYEALEKAKAEKFIA